MCSCAGMCSSLALHARMCARSHVHAGMCSTLVLLDARSSLLAFACIWVHLLVRMRDCTQVLLSHHAYLHSVTHILPPPHAFPSPPNQQVALRMLEHACVVLIACERFIMRSFLGRLSAFCFRSLAPFRSARRLSSSRCRAAGRICTGVIRAGSMPGPTGAGKRGRAARGTGCGRAGTYILARAREAREAIMP